MADLRRENVALAVHNILEKNGVSAFQQSIIRSGYAVSLKLAGKMRQLDLPGLTCNEIEPQLSGSILDGLQGMYLYFGLKGDLDILQVLKKGIAHKNMTKVTDTSELYQFLIQPSEGNPGHVLLKLIKEGSKDDLFGEKNNYIRGDKEDEYLSSKLNESFKNMHYITGGVPVIGTYHQVPSVLSDHGGMTKGFMYEKTRVVCGIPCSGWPPEAEEWLTRSSLQIWPPEDIITQIKQGGAYIVPIGCEGSPQQDMEWRYSFSHSEKHLILSLSSVQFKCFALLELLHIFIFREVLGDIISSYIMRTSLLWIAERTASTCWTPSLLMDCTKRCLIRIRDWVTKDFCPHYIMREFNLLRNRYNTEEKGLVLKTLTDVINNLESYVCNLPPVMKELQYKSLQTLAQENDTSMRQMQNLSLDSTVPTLMDHTEAVLKGMSLDISLEACYGNLAAVHEDLEIISSLLSAKIQEYFSNLTSEDFCRFGLIVVLTAKNHVLSVLQQLSDPGSLGRGEILRHIAALKKTCHPIRGKKFLVNWLYLATVYLSMQNMHRALEAVQRVDQYFQTHPYIRLDCTKGLHQPTMLHISMWLAVNIAKLNSNVFINDVHFALGESSFLPKPIQFEVILRAKTYRVTDLPDSDRYFLITAIDPLVFSGFIQFWCHSQLQNNMEQLKAIKSLQKRCEDRMTTNKNIAWNLLGFCNQTVGNHKAAFNAYYQGLRENHKSKASMYYVAILVKEMMIIREKLV